MTSVPNPRNPQSPQGPHLALRQTQSLTITPALKQAIALLQMNNLELDALVEQEVQVNPFLDRAGDSEMPDTDVPSEKEKDYHGANNYEAPGTKHIDTPHDDKLEFDASNVFTGDVTYGETAEAFDTNPQMDRGSAGREDFGDTDYSLDNRVRNEDSLFDHVTNQIQMGFSAPQDRMIGLALMEGLDEAGYYRGNMHEISRQFECEISDVEMVLSRCQHFEPAGIFALNLAQCMEIQLRDQGVLTPVMQVMLANLSLLEKHDFKTLQKKCGVDEQELKNMLVSLRRLDPKPGAQFTHDIAQTLVPDILMRKNKDPNHADSWIVELNPDTLPRVLINQRYAAMIQSKGVKKEEKQFLIEKYQGAQFLVKAMDQRAQTIIKVAAEIIRQQEGFFNYGASYLKPLVLRNVAELVEVHESTVSRVTTGKYMLTPRGIFELKYFFSSSVGATKDNLGGEGMTHSSNAIKSRIKVLIDKEDPKKVLSDDDIVDLLKEDDITLARRTVTKYREAMGYGSSVDRRRQKRNL
ncbi:MAG: polymerase sigma-54 factor [Alphaproteobacteria bacterium]|nr:polymerase sigma-54 factor [Alphaproteobacteria bacterium]